jgi:hypothetical protein
MPSQDANSVPNSGTSNTNLSASYSSPTSAPFTITKSVAGPKSSDVAEKSRYLAELRSAAAAVQEQVNKELTQRMEEDKAREAASAGEDKRRNPADEAKDEENYGEEVGDADD